MKPKKLNRFFSGSGEMSALMREKDWAQTALGPPDTWPQSLLTTLSIILSSKFPMFLFWGPDLTGFYNDAYRPSLGRDGKHPAILGSRAADFWVEIWDDIKPLIDQVLSSGEATWSEDQLLPIYRNGQMENVYWTFSYSAVNDESGSPAGVFVTCFETTGKLEVLKKLIVSEERFRSLVEESIVGKAIFEGKDLRLIIANKAALNMWGKDSSAIGKPLLKFMPELEGQPLPEQLENVYLTRTSYAEKEALVYFKRGGKMEPTYIDALYKPLLDENGDIVSILVSGIDVTEKVLNRKKLEESTDELQFAINAAELGTWTFDTRHKIFTTNERLRNWFGLPGTEPITAEEVLDIIVPGDRQRVDQATRDALDYRNGGNYNIIYSIQNKLTGEVKIVHSKGKALFTKTNIAYSLRGTLQDVTEQFQLLNRVESSVQNLQLMILQAPVAICLMRGNSHVVEIANARMLELWGKTSEEMIGKPVFEGLYEVKGQGLEDILDDVYKTGNVFKASEMPIDLPRNGKLERLFVNFVYQPLRNSNDEIDGVIAIANDVSAQVLARKKVEESEQQLSTLIKNAPFAIAICMGKAHEIEIANQAIIDLWGKGENVLGKRFRDLLPELEVQGMYGQLDKVYETGRPFHADNQFVELNIKGKKEGLYLNYTLTPLRNSDQEVYGVMITAIDISDLNKAQQALEESEIRFRNVANSAPVLIWMSGVDKGVHFFNKAWLNYTGRPLEEELGNGWTANVHPDDVAAVMEKYHSAFDNREEYYIEFRLRRSDGEYRWLSDKAVPRFTRNNVFEGYIGACMDINDQVLYQDKLISNEEKLNIALEATGLGTWELDLVKDDISYSDRYLEIMGFPARSNATHDEFLKTLHPDDLDLRNREFKKALTTGTLAYELRLRHPDHTLHWIQARGKVFFDENGKPVKMLGTVRDITDEKKHEQDLMEREQKFRLLADSMPQIVWTGSPDGSQNYFNRSFHEFTGLSAEEVLKDGWFQILPPGERETNLNDWNKSIASGSDFTVEHRFRRHDGAYRWQLSRAIPQRDENGNIQMWVGTSTDIHEIKEQEEKKDYFISMASHELKTPITSVKGYVQILQSIYNNKGDDFLNNSLTILNRQVDTLTNLISDLLDVSKIKSDILLFKNYPFNLDELVADTVNELKHIHQDYKLILKNSVQLPVMGDRQRIGQVITNFITNAIKYSPGDKEIIIECRSQNDRAIVKVKDEGIGIDKYHQQKIFERFYRVEGKNEDTFPGFGIGLYIASEIIKKHQGQIGVVSEPGKGSEFYFSLKLTDSN